MIGDRPGLVVFGAGRMGHLVHDAAGEAGFGLVAVVSHRRPGWVNPGLFSASLEDVGEGADLLIDFSLPHGTLEAAAWCADNNVPLLSGTTGLDEEHQSALEVVAQLVPVLWAANFSIGVNLALELVALAAQRLEDVKSLQITDVHHVHKKDAPSGTSLALGSAAAPHTPEYDSKRQGNVVGFHEVRFNLAGEEVGVIHNASDRGIYARGALRAGQWLLAQKAGFYGARDAFS